MSNRSMEAGLERDPASKPVPAEGARKHGYIDAVRGWAILMVITAHVGGRFAGLPFPVKKLTNFGWHGVQLFFLASAVTLALSWRRSPGPLPRKTLDFFLRRLLRIAPMYYAGALLYTLAWPPHDRFSVAQLLRTLLFVNAWNPDWIPTTPGWMVVPGGWSIGVEFTFYAMFPVLIVTLTTLRRAIGFALVAIVLAASANAGAAAWLAGTGEPAVTNFLYFWFPNQLPVFAIGLVLHHLLLAGRPRIGPAAARLLAAAAVIACVAAAELPAGSARFAWSMAPPQILIATLALAAFVLALAAHPRLVHPGLLVHPAIRRLGVLSFSCYVLHFLFVQEIPGWSGGLIDVSAGGWRAILMLALLWPAVVAATVGCAATTHRLIEQPGIRLAQRLTSGRAGGGIGAGIGAGRAIRPEFAASQLEHGVVGRR